MAGASRDQRGARGRRVAAEGAANTPPYPAEDVLIRPPRPGDGQGLAETKLEAAVHLSDLDASLFRPVSPDGRAERLERTAVLEVTPDTFWRVAEVGGRIVGYVQGVLQRPTEADRRAAVRYVGQLRVWVNALMVQQAFARRGIATGLMSAVEEWAREQGAELVMLQTWAGSPESVPFYERIGYRRRAIIFQKEL